MQTANLAQQRLAQTELVRNRHVSQSGGFQPLHHAIAMPFAAPCPPTDQAARL